MKNFLVSLALLAIVLPLVYVIQSRSDQHKKPTPLSFYKPIKITIANGLSETYDIETFKVIDDEIILSKVSKMELPICKYRSIPSFFSDEKYLSIMIEDKDSDIIIDIAKNGKINLIESFDRVIHTSTSTRAFKCDKDKVFIDELLKALQSTSKAKR